MYQIPIDAVDKWILVLALLFCNQISLHIEQQNHSFLNHQDYTEL
ncbi:hypothetical protein RintRC_7395 [Richelia intracellularis]|nr:hypothetical protein RintRC_7395 [Richelia intracellularis]